MCVIEFLIMFTVRCYNTNDTFRDNTQHIRKRSNNNFKSLNLYPLIDNLHSQY